MAKRHPDLPFAPKTTLSRKRLLDDLMRMDGDPVSRERVLRLETAFQRKIDSHIVSLPATDSIFQKFNTNPYVLLIHARQRKYTKVSALEADILPAKQFSSMETSAGRMVEEVVLPEYGWEYVASEMHTSDSALDGKSVQKGICRLATLKSGPRCLNDEMSENFADAILANYKKWANEASVTKLDFTYGVLYGTKKQSNKKDWHILRNLRDKRNRAMIIGPDRSWDCAFKEKGITVNVAVRIGLEWWRHLGGDLCFIEVFTALIRACVNAGAADAGEYRYAISDLNSIVNISKVREDYNVSLLQRSQIPWLFLMARHFCDELAD